MELNLGHEIWMIGKRKKKKKEKEKTHTHSCSENDQPSINTWFRKNDNWNLIIYN